MCAQRSESSLSAWRKLGSLATHIERTAKTLIRLGGCPGWSESSLGAHTILLDLSWGGSIIASSPRALTALWGPRRGETHKMASAPSQDSGQYVQSSLSEWRSCPREHSEDWSNCVDAQAYQSSQSTPNCIDFFSIELTILRPSQHYYIYIELFLWRAWECKSVKWVLRK